MAALLLRVALAVHALGAAVYWGLQPRGFSWFSRSFFEHQVLVPVFALSSLLAAAAPDRWKQARLAAFGLVAGFWAGVSLGTAFAASPAFAMVFGAIFLAAAALLLRHSRRAAGGLLAGLGLGAAFLFATTAPPATTRPLTQPLPAPAPSTETVPIDVRHGTIVIGQGRDRLLVDPRFQFDSVSAGGHWTIFNFSRRLLPDPDVRVREAARWELTSTAPGIHQVVDVWCAGGEVHLRATTRLDEEVASHLSRVMTIVAPGPAVLEGRPWPASDGDAPLRFVAFRGDQVDFLQAASKEKGPFEVLSTGPARDPVLDAGPWRIQVRGWAAQASRAESPTAGWGVSQGAIEHWNGVFSWSLASTSIGRGWHAVRTAPGLYVLEAVVARRP